MAVLAIGTFMTRKIKLCMPIVFRVAAYTPFPFDAAPPQIMGHHLICYGYLYFQFNDHSRSQFEAQDVLPHK